MNLYEKIQKDRENRESYMASIVDTVEKLENNYAAVQQINRRIQYINEGAWAFGFLSESQKGKDILKQLKIQRRVLRMRKMLINRLAAVSQTKLLKVDNRIEHTYELAKEVEKVFFPEQLTSKAG